uniref:Brix domain-containing protein n=1 Tax=Panagrolaimus sp. ES5 TaxID=591445 RepID=A0AC34GCI2_9BILA
MLRRKSRERRELVYRRSLDQKKRDIQEKREKEKPKFDNSKPKDPFTLPSDIDDEYRWAGVEDPVVCITTSHNPSAKLKKFAKEITLMVPNAKRVNRGNNDI